MAYTINLTNGTVLTTIADGTVNTTSSSLKLIGKNYSGYGTFLNDNLVHILENASNSTAPAAPLTGQLWWDTAGNLKVYTGSTFQALGQTTVSNTTPSSAVTGGAWWDTSNQQLKIYDSTAGWTLIGPAFTANSGTSGTIVGQIVDSGNVSHYGVNVYVSNQLVSIISKDAEYTPAGNLTTTFPTIKPGFNLISTSGLSGVAYWGTASDASGLGNVTASKYARTDAAAGTVTFNNQLNFLSDSGYSFGSSNNFKVSVSGTVVQLTNIVNNADLVLKANIAGTQSNAIIISGTSGAVTVPNVLSVSGNISATNYLLATKNEEATSSTTGALRVTGGIGLTGNVYAAGNVNAVLGVFSGNVTGANLNAGTGNVNATYGVFSSNVVAANVRVTGNVNANYLVGTSINALYADLAERFEADAYYTPGTVLAIGGTAEVTVENEELSENVFGVISTRAGYLMNSGAGPNETHPPVAVNGRVPVRVVGKVSKGDRLVSAGNGLARAGSKSEITPFNVIGRSLENKLTDQEGTILAIVKLNS